MAIFGTEVALPPFNDVKIVDAAYIVRAKTADGSSAVMSINPSDQALNSNPSTGQKSK